MSNKGIAETAMKSAEDLAQKIATLQKSQESVKKQIVDAATEAKSSLKSGNWQEVLGSMGSVAELERALFGSLESEQTLLGESEEFDMSSSGDFMFSSRTNAEIEAILEALLKSQSKIEELTSSAAPESDSATGECTEDMLDELIELLR